MKDLSSFELDSGKNLFADKNAQIFKRCTDILLNLKIQPDVLGFNFLRSAILICLDDRTLLENITGALYPRLAKFYAVKVSIIERCMRDAVNNAFVKGGLLGLNNLYGKIIYKNDFRPSSTELIAIIVEKLRTERIKNTLLQLLAEDDSK